MPAKSQNSEEQLIIDDGQDGSTTEGPWSRLKGLVEMALAPVPIGARVEPPPEEFKQWGVNTAVVMAAGLCLGGLKQWWVERKMPDMPSPSSAPTKAHIARFKAEMQTRRLARLLNATVRSGLWCGTLGGVYYAVQGLSLYARQEDDAYNTVFGSWAAGGLMGVALGSGGVVKRLGSVSLGAGIAGLVGFPVGLLQQYLAMETNPLKPKKPTQSVPQETDVPYRKNDSDLVGELVNHLENSLQKTSDQPDSSKTTP